MLHWIWEFIFNCATFGQALWITLRTNFYSFLIFHSFIYSRAFRRCWWDKNSNCAFRVAFTWGNNGIMGHIPSYSYIVKTINGSTAAEWNEMMQMLCTQYLHTDVEWNILVGHTQCGCRCSALWLLLLLSGCLFIDNTMKGKRHR